MLLEDMYNTKSNYALVASNAQSIIGLKELTWCNFVVTKYYSVMNYYRNKDCIDEDAEKHKKIWVGDNLDAIFIVQYLQ